MSEHIFTLIFISIIMVFLNSALFYELTALTLKTITKFKMRERPLMFFLVSSIFFAHTASVWIYAACYWVMVTFFNFQSLDGSTEHHFLDYVYFSAITYSSLGFGDIYPIGGIRFVASVEVLNGLVMIGWSIMITYFSIQRLWDTHWITNNR